MKNKGIYLNISFFIIGVLLCYFLTQFHYFKINLEINILELFLSVLTLIVGLYIADVIQNKQVKRQNLYSFLQSKLDEIWEAHSVFIIQLKEPRIDLKRVLSYHKDLTRKISFLTTLFTSLELNNSLVNGLEQSIDKIEFFLTSQKMSENIIDLETIYPEIENHISNTDSALKDIFLYLHNI